MAKVTFASLKLKVKDAVKTVNIGEKEIEIKQYLSAEDKYDLIMISLQQSKENGIYNDFKLDMFLHLNLVFMYTNLTFTDKQREDLPGLYDILETNGIIELVAANIPEHELSIIYTSITEVKNSLVAYENSIGGTVNNFITSLPANAQAAADIVDNFDPEKYGEVIKFAKAIGMRE
jgi:hypothetical protein